MGDQIGGDGGHAGFGTDHLFQHGPLGFQPGLLAFFLTFREFLDIGIDHFQFFGRIFPPQFRLTR